MSATYDPRFRRRNRLWALTVLIPLVLLAGCAADPAPAEPIGTPKPTVRPTTPPEPELFPLRGTERPDGAGIAPALSVKIDNHEEARPQIGLERTDLVFEELVEGGLTRYVAVWHSDLPELVGPIRSIRPMDPDIITPLGGIVAYSGGQQVFVDMMSATPIVNAVFDYDDTGLFYRIDEKDSPHDVVVKATELVASHAELAPPSPQFLYAPSADKSSAALDGIPTSVINSRFSDSRWPSWSWDAAQAGYLRSQEGEPDLDSAGASLRATNVIVLRVGVDWTYGEVPKTVLIGSGEAWVSSGGKSIHATWSKEAQSSPIRLVADSGTLITLAAGNTWIELVPTETGSVELVP